MARSHHRKKHKTHLRQFQHDQDTGTDRIRNSSSTGTLVVIGIILGLAVGYFASGSVPLWIAAGGIAGGLLGYLVGRYLDRDLRQ